MELTGQSCVLTVGTEENRAVPQVLFVACMGSKMIKNIIFDIGNVLAAFGWKEYFKGFGYEEALLERLAQATTLSPCWNEYDRGELSDEEILQSFIQNDPEIEEIIRATLTRVHGLVTGYDYAVNWVKELKEKGYGVYYLSNFAKTARQDCEDALGFLEYMDGGIFSYEEKLIKPEPAIYQLLLKRYGLVAEECVFLDDSEKNIIAAKKEGFYGILFRNQEQAVEELRKLGVEA